MARCTDALPGKRELADAPVRAREANIALGLRAIGGFVVDFGLEKRSGSSFVELSIIGKNGRFLQ